MGLFDRILGKTPDTKNEAMSKATIKKFPPIGNSEPICPYCGYKFEKMPQKKKKCPNCNNFVRSRTRPSDNKKVLIKESELEALERQWAIKNEQSRGIVFGASKEAIEQDKRNYANEIKKNLGNYPGISDENLKIIRDIIIRHHIENKKLGASIQEIVHQVDGITKEQASLIIQTEWAEALNRLTLKRYKKEGVEEVEVLVALDNQTCDICRSFNGKRFSIDNPPKMPVHMGCRCTFIPFIDIHIPKME